MAKKNKIRILITGGAGFIGHHLVDHVLRNTGWEVVILDRLSYAAHGLSRLRDSRLFDSKRVFTLTSDFTKPIVDGLAQEIGQVDYIAHLGAETHVDRSIADPRPFVYSNVVGTMELLEFAKTQKKLLQFLYFSTDEIFGPAVAGMDFAEWDRYNSSTPYAASKAGGEELVLAYANTYMIPSVITHCMNVFGERQWVEKFIPSTIRKVLKDETVTIHGDVASGRPGSRYWIHARNVADATLYLLTNGQFREKYNIVGEVEVDNLRMAKLIAEFMGKKLKYELVDCNTVRPGHDLRYGLNGGKLRSMGWKQPLNFVSCLEKTVKWTLKNRRWLDGLEEKPKA